MACIFNQGEYETEEETEETEYEEESIVIEEGEGSEYIEEERQSGDGEVHIFSYSCLYDCWEFVLM